MMKKFEYMMLKADDEGFWVAKINYQSLTDKLNYLGAQGWELVTSLDVNREQGSTKEVVLLLKREI